MPGVPVRRDAWFPTIAQLVERRTVVGAEILRSLVRIRLVGTNHHTLFFYIILVIFVIIFGIIIIFELINMYLVYSGSLWDLIEAS